MFFFKNIVFLFWKILWNPKVRKGWDFDGTVIYLNSNFLNVKVWYQFLVGSWYEICTTSIFQHFNFTFSVSLSFSIYIVKKGKENKNNNNDGIKQNKLWRRKKEKKRKNRSILTEYCIIFRFRHRYILIVRLFRSKKKARVN